MRENHKSLLFPHFLCYGKPTSFSHKNTLTWTLNREMKKKIVRERICQKATERIDLEKTIKMTFEHDDCEEW